MTPVEALQPVPRSKPVTRTSRLVAQITPLVAFGVFTQTQRSASHESQGEHR